MRREFSDWATAYARTDSKFLFLTGDLGFMALEALREEMGARFINAGVSEQNLVAVAASLAKEGLHPLCYSIAPFLVFRPYEQIRLDVALHSLPVRFVGNGGGYGYGIMGASHHALQDLAVLSCLPNFECVIPLCNEDVAGAADYMMQAPLKASYLRLGAGFWPTEFGASQLFAPVRTLQKTAKPKLSVVGIGPVLLNALPVIRTRPVDCFAVSVLPAVDLPEVFVESVVESGALWVVEEHVGRGGLGEFLCAQLARLGVRFRFHHSHACGYPDGLYGSQMYHQEASGLDTESLRKTLKKLLNSHSP
jgi:transketolase